MHIYVSHSSVHGQREFVPGCIHVVKINVTDVMDRACACLKSILHLGMDKDHRKSNWVLLQYEILEKLVTYTMMTSKVVYQNRYPIHQHLGPITVLTTHKTHSSLNSANQKCFKLEFCIKKLFGQKDLPDQFFHHVELIFLWNELQFFWHQVFCPTFVCLTVVIPKKLLFRPRHQKRCYSDQLIEIEASPTRG